MVSSAMLKHQYQEGPFWSLVKLATGRVLLGGPQGSKHLFFLSFTKLNPTNVYNTYARPKHTPGVLK